MSFNFPFFLFSADGRCKCRNNLNSFKLVRYSLSFMNFGKDETFNLSFKQLLKLGNDFHETGKNSDRHEFRSVLRT